MKNKDIYLQMITLYYYRYKAFFVPVIIITTCIVLFIVVIIPQFLHILSIQHRIANESGNLQVLQQNFQHVSSLNDDQLNAQYQLAVSALPAEKDVIAILNTIAATASKANVSLQDYNFAAGTIAGTGAASKTEVVLNLTGNINSIQQFMHLLKTSLPLSDIASVHAGDSNTSTLTIMFYTKPFSKDSFDENVPLQLLTPQDQKVLDTLASWQEAQ